MDLQQLLSDLVEAELQDLEKPRPCPITYPHNKNICCHFCTDECNATCDDVAEWSHCAEAQR